MVKKISFENFIVPRPVTELPEYANAKARQACADKLFQSFRLSERAARLIADVVVEPSALRKAVGEPDDPNYEEILVHGGKLKGLRTTVWSYLAMPDARNPRIGPSRKHPFAVEPGSAEEDSRFRPVPEPRVPGEDPCEATLAVEVDNRYHLKWASELAAKFVLADNDWRDSIAAQGVMEHVWLVPTLFRHLDHSDDALALVSVEGSSRTTAVHSLLGIVSGDIPYSDDPARLVRSAVKQANQNFKSRNDLQAGVALRCSIMPALILVGFEPSGDGATEFPTAVKSMVALRHVEPPKPWGDGPANEALADEVLDELLRQRLITDVEHDYYAGTLTKIEAVAARMSGDPSIRASKIVRLFSNPDDRYRSAIRAAISSQSTKKKVTKRLTDDLSTALILRGESLDRILMERARRYMRESFASTVHENPWRATDRPIEAIEREAEREVQSWIAAGQEGDPGPNSLELSVRSVLGLIVESRLLGDLGRKGLQPDHRTPGEVLESMRRKIQGVRQLGSSCQAALSNRPFVAVDETGNVLTAEDGESALLIDDSYLRRTFPIYGKAPAPNPGESPSERLDQRIHGLDTAMSQLGSAFRAVYEVLGDNGKPVVETFGIDTALSSNWRSILAEIDEELIVLDRIYRRRHGTQVRPAADSASSENAQDSDIEDESEIEEVAQ